MSVIGTNWRRNHVLKLGTTKPRNFSDYDSAGLRSRDCKWRGFMRALSENYAIAAFARKRATPGTRRNRPHALGDTWRASESIPTRIPTRRETVFVVHNGIIENYAKSDSPSGSAGR
jgi:glucosamine 6-phosphate synthetase-like amidotransferase/phosphosugar isomerase protein